MFSYINSNSPSSQSPILLNSGYLIISNSNFTNCISSNKGGVILVSSGSILVDYGSTFEYNLASLGGAIYSSQSVLNLTNTILLYNYAINGGAIMADSKTSSFNLTGMNCSYNVATNTGSALYFIGTSSSSISSSIFSFNTAFEGNTISLLFSPTILTGIVLMNNIALAESTGIFINFSEILIKDSIFNTTIFPNGKTSLKDAAISSNIFGCFISISAGATVTILNSTFQNGYAVFGGFIYIAGNSQTFIVNSLFKKGYAKSNGGAIYGSGYKMLSITGCSFDDNNCEQDGSDICLNSGVTVISNCNYLLTPNPSSLFLSGGSFTGSSLQMENTEYSKGVLYTDYYGSAIYASNMDSFYLNDSSFSLINFGGYGGVLYLAESLSQSVALNSPAYTIENCLFDSNSANFGGVIYLHNINYILILSCIFTNNSAISTLSSGGFGGAIYYFSSSLSPGSSSIFTLGNGNVFQNNHADIAGGAIYWDFNQPNNITLPKYINNIAKKYGDNYGCFAQVLKTISEFEYNSSKSSNRQLDSISRSTSISISSQQSGSTLNSIFIALFDEFGEIVGSDSTSTTTLSIMSTSSNVNYTPTLTGTVTQKAKNGMFAFSNITFIAEPNKSYSLLFTTTGIDPSKPSNKYYLSQVSKINTDMQVSISLRPCGTGEMFTSTGACIECAGPDYYLLTEQTSPGNCKACQSWKMYCYGGSDVGPKPGYWRSSLTSDNFIQCLYSGACKGYIKPSENKLGECFTGYQGILCGECTIGFSKTENYRCDKCPDPAWNVIRLILISICVLIWIVIMIRSTLVGASQRK